MFDIDRWREIFQAISKNKLRTILTGFTISFAILLFTLLFGIGNGLKIHLPENLPEMQRTLFLLILEKLLNPIKAYKLVEEYNLKMRITAF